MRTLLLLSTLALAALLPGAALADDDPYYARAGAHPAQLPAERDPSYDCTDGASPHGPVESAQYDLASTLRGERWGLPYVAPGCLALDAGLAFPAPPGAPLVPGSPKVRCVRSAEVPVAEVDPGLAADPCHARLVKGPSAAAGGLGEVSLRATYNVTSGRYFVQATLPTDGTGILTGALEHGVAMSLLWIPTSVSGDSGTSVEFDCIECPPPWEQ